MKVGDQQRHEGNYYLLFIIYGHNWVKWPERESDHKPLYNVELLFNQAALLARGG